MRSHACGSHFPLPHGKQVREPAEMTMSPHSSHHKQGIKRRKGRITNETHTCGLNSVLVGLQVITQHLTVGNPGHAVAAVTWTSSNPAVTVEPANANVAAGSEQQFQACIKGSGVGQLQAQLQCSVKHGRPQAVEVTARVTGE